MNAKPILKDALDFTLYVPGMPFHGGTLDAGRSLGGSESAGYYLARELARRGHRVTVFSAIAEAEAGSWDGVAYRGHGARTAETPFGAAFEAYAATAPCDVLIGQRAPGLFRRMAPAKVTLWWAHDLALKRHLAAFNPQVWNLNGILCVSEFHREQLAAVYGVRPEAVHVVQNGVDPSLFHANAPAQEKAAGRVLVYSSRPERGLEHLVGGPDGAPGVMERLHRVDPSIQLRVCAYDNVTPDLAGYYAMLAERCRRLPNVQWLGALSKRELAALLGSAWLHVYPTTFEEVSCIAAMEAQCAGTPTVTSPVAALPETLRDAGAHFVPLANGGIDPAAFAQAILDLRDAPDRWRSLHGAALAAAPRYAWTHAAEAVERVVADTFRRQCGSPHRLAAHFRRLGDHAALAALHQEHSEIPGAEIAAAQSSSLDPVPPGLHVRPDLLLVTPPLQALATQLATLPEGARVLLHGAREELRRAIQSRFAKLKIAVEGTEPPGAAHHLVASVDALHRAADPGALADALAELVSPGGTFWASVPCGPWRGEALVDRGEGNLRQHLEAADLRDLFAHQRVFQMAHLHTRFTAEGEPLGHHIVSWRAHERAACRAISMERKLRVQRPRELLSVCMIVRPDGLSLARCLRSVRKAAAQIVIGIDAPAAAVQNTPAWRIAAEHGAEAFAIDSPLRTGFDAARNATLDRAAGDWVLWIDDDEELIWPERLAKYLRDNPYDAYAVAQHHFAVEPGGVIKTDYPCRLFRTGRGFRFFGVVHEHPELALNQGPGRCLLLPDVAICHGGYVTEDVRRRRFQRNLPLMLRDREQYKDRLLGKFLWIRDLAHLNRFEFEQTHAVSPRMRSQAEEAVTLWRELLSTGQTRLAVDALPYYSECAGLLTPAPISLDLALGGRRLGIGDPDAAPPVLRGHFADAQDAERLTQALLKEKLEGLAGKYI